MTTASLTPIRGYVAGTWDIDPIHSDVSFTVRHMMVSKVRGRFRTFSGWIVTGADVTGSAVAASIEPASVDTGNTLRDRHLRSADFRLPLDGGGVVVGDEVRIDLEIEAVLRRA